MGLGFCDVSRKIVSRKRLSEKKLIPAIFGSDHSKRADTEFFNGIRQKRSLPWWTDTLDFIALQRDR